MKFKLSILAVISLSIFLLSGCSSCSTSKNPLSAPSQTASVVDADKPPATPPGLIASNPDNIVTSSSAPTAPPQSQAGGNTSTDEDDGTEHSVTGIIDSAGMGKYFVELDDGRLVAFHFDGVDISGLTNTLPGSPITVYYYGVLDGADTSRITVTRMVTPSNNG